MTSFGRGNRLPNSMMWIIAAGVSFWWTTVFGGRPTTEGGGWLLALPFFLFPILLGLAFPERHSSRRALVSGGLSTGGASAAAFLFLGVSTGNRNDAETIVVVFYSLVAVIPLATVLAVLLISFSSRRRLRTKGTDDC